MNEDYKELLSLLDLKDIKLLDSHERLVAISDSYNEENVNVNTEQMIPVNDPVFEEDCMRVHPKYVFTFSVGDVIYFKCEYILLASFYCKNPERVKELLKIEEVKSIFLGSQMNRTLWSILRGIVMDAFNRHSLKPVILPWIK